MLKRTMSLLAGVMMLAMILAACGGTPAASSPTAVPATNAPAEQPTAAPAEQPTAAAEEPTAAAEPTSAPEEPTAAADAEPTAEVPPTPTQVNISTFDQAAAGNRTVVRWFVGLGAGTQPPQIPLEMQAVDKFNESQDEIYLSIEIIDNRQAYNVLATRIASGDVPDIIGPVGVRGRNGFKGQLLDLSSLIQSTNFDVTQFPQELVEYYNVEEQGQIGLPYAIYPSFIYFNKDLFDEAGLPYPPQKYGEQYDGKEWNMETLREVAMKLTVDEAGNDATSPDFDPTKVEQFGLHAQWVNQDIRALGSFFTPGTLVGPDGKAQIPEAWREAVKWWYAAIHTDHFAPSDPYINSDPFGNTNVFNTGKLGMAWTHIWYTGGLDGPETGSVKNWDIAVMPSYNGKPTSKLHADTFSIMKGTKNPEAAFEVLQFLMKSPELQEAYGAMPALTSEQPNYFANLDEKYAPLEINWQVAIDSLAYPDDPSHEEDMPNFVKAQNDLQTFTTTLRNDPDLDVDAGLDELKQTLDQTFSEAAAQ
jgi:multiple sugar transport system substrate-binding protein